MGGSGHGACTAGRGPGRTPAAPNDGGFHAWSAAATAAENANGWPTADDTAAYANATAATADDDAHGPSVATAASPNDGSAAAAAGHDAAAATPIYWQPTAFRAGAPPPQPTAAQPGQLQLCHLPRPAAAAIQRYDLTDADANDHIAAALTGAA